MDYESKNPFLGTPGTRFPYANNTASPPDLVQDPEL
jgi:hypothetical protein